jgi:hypothetical protein
MDGGVGENARLFTVLLCCYGVAISRVGVNRSTTNESRQQEDRLASFRCCQVNLRNTVVCLQTTAAKCLFSCFSSTAHRPPSNRKAFWRC